MKNILIIQAHPVKDTFSEHLKDAYKNGAESAKGNVKILKLSELNFDLNFTQGYRGNQELEEDLVNAQKLISWADHLVFIYPNWWATFPALLKGFIDRTFLPGFAFKYREDSLLWDKLLTGKSARLIVTMDSPTWYYKWFIKAPGHHAMKKGILEFCGIKPVKITSFGPIKKSTVNQRNKWLKKVELFGNKLK